VRRYLSPAKDVPDAEIPDTFDPSLWERISGADIKFALKESWNMYVESWKGEIAMNALNLMEIGEW
jgi:hypothetical protein